MLAAREHYAHKEWGDWFVLYREDGTMKAAGPLHYCQGFATPSDRIVPWGKEGSVSILCPSYRLDGFLIENMEPITAGMVWYTCDTHPWLTPETFPPHAREAIARYRDTIINLLLAGF